MNLSRSLVPVALLFASVAGATGCKDEAPPPTPEPSTSALAAGKEKMNARAPSPMAKVDPQAMKEYRVDVCYFGTLTLKQARDAYLASLGKDEPSEKKIPSFGAPSVPSAAGTSMPAAPGPTGAAKTPPAGAKPTSTAAPKSAAAAPASPKPAAPPAGGAAKTPAVEAKADMKAPAAAAASGNPKAPFSEMRPDARRPFDIAMRAPHERNARACTVAAGLKEFAMPDVDAALAPFAPFAVELAKTITAASSYYQREEYKKDSFEKGKEFHKKLVSDFAKLDELSDKVGTAIAAWHKDHPVDPAKSDEGQKLAQSAFEDAREILVGVLPKKFDLAAHKERTAKLEKSVEALKAYGTANAADVWSKNLGPSLDSFLKTVKDAEPKVAEKGVQQDSFLSLITGFTAVIEAKYRALSRSLIAKGQTELSRANPSMPAPRPPAPVPAPSEAPAAPHSQ